MIEFTKKIIYHQITDYPNKFDRFTIVAITIPIPIGMF